MRLQPATTGFVQEGHGVGKEREHRDAVATGDWLRVIPFQITKRTVHFARTGSAVHPSTTKLSWSSHRFYICKFSPKSAM